MRKLHMNCDSLINIQYATSISTELIAALEKCVCEFSSLNYIITTIIFYSVYTH